MRKRINLQFSPLETLVLHPFWTANNHTRGRTTKITSKGHKSLFRIRKQDAPSLVVRCSFSFPLSPSFASSSFASESLKSDVAGKLLSASYPRCSRSSFLICREEQNVFACKSNWCTLQFSELRGLSAFLSLLESISLCFSHSQLSEGGAFGVNGQVVSLPCNPSD